MNLVRHLLGLGPITPAPLADAKFAWKAWRKQNGWGPDAPLLTPPDGNVKLAKTKRVVYGLSLAPSTLSGFNVCPNSSPKCVMGCVAFAGKGEMPAVQRARITKTEFLAYYPNEFVALLEDEIERAIVRHDTHERKVPALGVRLNTFSDIPWEAVAPSLFAPSTNEVVFYDYTKDWSRDGLFNYHLTYSVSENTATEAILAKVRNGRNVAVVFDARRGEALPSTWIGIPVVNGDESDDRTADPRGVVVGLRAKGRMRHPMYEGFVKPALSNIDQEVAA